MYEGQPQNTVTSAVRCFFYECDNGLFCILYIFSMGISLWKIRVALPTHARMHTRTHTRVCVRLCVCVSLPTLYTSSRPLSPPLPPLSLSLYIYIIRTHSLSSPLPPPPSLYLSLSLSLSLSRLLSGCFFLEKQTRKDPASEQCR